MPRRVSQADKGQDKIASSTVVKAVHVLHTLADICDNQPDGASVSEISRQSGESPSSVCKHLAAFQRTGLVEQDSRTERYRIGIFSLRLASIALKTLNIRDIASPFLRRIAEQIGETVHLVVRDGLRVVYIDKVESSKTIRMHSEIGLRNPMYCTGVGKAILAFSPLPLIEAVVAEGMVPFTPNTLTTRRALLDDLEKVRKRGYALDDGEHELEVCCAAAPILNHLREPAASFSVSGPRSRIDDDRLREIGEMVRDIALQISARLGYR